MTEQSQELAPARLTLWDIEAAWLELIQARQEAEAIENPGEREQALAACDGAIAEYVHRETMKVDGIRAVCRALKSAVAEARQERDYQAKRMQSAEALLDRIKALAQTAMEAAGKKRIDGRTGYLLVKKNGSVEPLEVYDAAMLPDEVCYWEGRIADQWMRDIQFALAETFGDAAPIAIKTMLQRVPDNAAIRAALAGPCPPCDGGGRAKIGWAVECAVCHLTKAPRGRSAPLEMANSLCNHECPGYALDPDPGSLWPREEAHSGMTGLVCGACGGSGRNAVPGARLLERGSHLEIK